VLTADRLEALAELDNVLKVHVAGHKEKHLDHSVPDIRANLAWNVASPTATPPDVRGKGVVIGVIDSGIDAFHRAFRNADGSTRIEFLWDQVLEDPARHPTNFPMGIEFDWHAIDQALTSHPSGDLPPSLLDGDEVDKHGHGTNVAGIAAGNGADPERCGREFQFVGVAPEANIVIVKVGFGNDSHGNQKRNDVLQALDYIFEKAGARACVVNISSGSHQAPHNGFADDDVRIDAVIAHHENLAQTQGHGTKTIVVSAGNDGNQDRHAYVEVAHNTPAQTVRVQVGNKAPVLGFFISYNGDALIECRIILPQRPGAAARQTPVHHTMEAAHENVGNHDVHFIRVDPFAGDPGAGTPGDPDFHFDIQISNAGGAPVESGTWGVEINNVSGNDARCHLWIYTPEKDGAAFLPPQGAPVSPQDVNRARKRPPEWSPPR
jgi:Subtilase family